MSLHHFIFFACCLSFTLSSCAQNLFSLRLSPPDVGVEGRPVELTAWTAGKNLEYKFYASYTDVGVAHTVLIRDYATATTCRWLPLQPAVYSVVVSIREKGSTTELAQKSANYTVKPYLLVDQDLLYGQAQGYDGKEQKLLLDAYARREPGVQNRPVIILVHGGGFGGGDKAQGLYVQMAQAFARADYIAFSINYRLAPSNVPIDTILDNAVADATTAVDWIRQNYARYGADPENISLAGDSAGGGLVVNTCYRDPAHVRARVCLDLWGGLPATPTSDPNYPWSGPIYPPALVAGTPPTCLIHGQADSVVPYQTSVDLSAKLTAAGITNVLHPLAGANHYPQERAAEFIPWMIQFANQFAYPSVGTKQK